MRRQLRWTQVDEQEHSASPETPESGETAPATGPMAAAGPEAVTEPAPGPGRDRRGDGVRDVITSRGAGWAVAAAMAGAVVGLSVAMATSSSPTVVVQPDRAAGLRGTQAGTVRALAPGGARRAVGRGGRVQAQAPARLRIQAPARVRIQIPAAGPLQAPARLRIRIPAGGQLQAPLRLRIQAPARVRLQIPAAGPLQAPPQLRLVAPVPRPAGTLVPLPTAAQVLPGNRVIARAVTPRAVRLRVRPGQVRVRLRVPANGRLQVLPGRPASGPLRVVAPGPRPAALVPAAPARLRIVSRNGTTVPARSVIPAGLPGQARLRIQVPARARIQVPARARIQIPARARITKALPAPPNW